MYAATCIFKYLGYRAGSDGSVECYLIEAADLRNDTVVVLNVSPDKLISVLAMKRILLGHRIFYSATKKEHQAMLSEIFRGR